MEDEIPTNEMDKMKIAWRYEGLNQVESSFGSNTNFGHNFDLSKHFDAETIKDSDFIYCNLSQHYENKAKGWKYQWYKFFINILQRKNKFLFYYY